MKPHCSFLISSTCTPNPRLCSEFVAEEAMHHLGIATTRGLSLTVSGTETVQRPWYSESSVEELVSSAESTNADDDGGGAWTLAKAMALTVDHPALAHVPAAKRAATLEAFREQLRQQAREPDLMRTEAAAIAVRVAPSFLRVGHFDLLARRLARDRTAASREELERLVAHALAREFGAEVEAAGGIAHMSTDARVALLLRAAGERIAALMADWLRVGFNQGNFNSDNCLVGGRTMDMGPFGFVERYSPDYVMWVGGGEHFAFMNQPQAALRNLGTLAAAVAPLVDSSPAGKAEVRAIVAQWPAVMDAAVQRMWARKLGFEVDNDGQSDHAANAAAKAAARSLYRELVTDLMVRDTVDYTITWRQLACLPDHVAAWMEADLDANAGAASAGAAEAGADASSPEFYADSVAAAAVAAALARRSDAALVAPQMDAFYEVTDCQPLSASAEARWAAFVRRWLPAIVGAATTGSSAGASDPSTAHVAIAALRARSVAMRARAPKFVPREWMLNRAYLAAEKGDMAPMHTIIELFQHVRVASCCLWHGPTVCSLFCESY